MYRIVRRHFGWSIGAEFPLVLEASTTEVEQQPDFDACCRQIVYQLDFVRHSELSYGLNFDEDKIIHEHVREEVAHYDVVIPHKVQLVNYLTATGIEIGLLLNFGGTSLEYKRKFRTYRPSEVAPDNPVHPANPVQ